ncbi:MAG: HAD family hydrolase [bacterium]|nr:HAD family hydrolase [bacterium]
MLKWIFFDVGNVILNDDPAMAVYYHQIFKVIQAQGNHVSFDQILADREASIVNNRDGRHYVSVALKHLGRKVWAQHEQGIRDYLMDNWANISPLMPAIVPVIQQLAEKYKLGIIANQPSSVVDVLREHAILDYFKILGISQMLGKSKPDRAFFRWALDQANCLPEQALMVGDRIDNDIVPARELGMRTLWLPLTLDKKNYTPKTEFEKKYFASLKRACVSHLPPRNQSETPDAIAKDFTEIIEQVRQIDED